MIVYTAKKNQFIEDVKSNQIHKIILAEFKRKMMRGVGNREIESWRNSMQYMYKLLDDPEIPAGSGVSIEYNIPLTGKRVDFILTGKDEDLRDTAIIIELKQWSKAKKTTKDGIVSTYLGRGETETSHPSYQAWTYAELIEDYNETVRKEKIALIPCAYLHNMDFPSAVNDSFYSEHISKAPVFISEDADRLSKFLKQYIKYDDTDDIMYRIENGIIKPSKNLADSLVSMIKGNREFLMIDDQKLVYETALNLSYSSQTGGKKVLIVKGGPGTGKSVVAINLLVELTKREKVVQYVSKNAAPRAVYAARLTGTLTKTKFASLFKGSGSYTETENSFFDVLVVDEAHRLNEKSGLYGNLGENQVKEIIAASKLSVFFLDEDQRVTLKDIGSNEEITKWAAELGAEVKELELQSQFRCNGSDGYLAWLDNSLQIRETVNQTMDEVDYDVQVFDSPIELRKAIFEKNLESNKSRMVAGYCWDWKSRKDPGVMDIGIPDTGFEAQWNLTKDGSLWIMAEGSVKQVGCIHTCQGLELDYVGVIIGPDFIVRANRVATDVLQRSSMDASIRGIKKQLKEDKETALEKADTIIKNTYRTLMSRGQKGCYIYCTDKETSEYFRAILKQNDAEIAHKAVRYNGLSLTVLTHEEMAPDINAVPLYDLEIAAGSFSDYQQAEDYDWVVLPEPFDAKANYFVARVMGESMNKRIPNGSWCLFKADVGGTRQGKIVLVQHRDIQDVEMGGQYTVKRYYSEKGEGVDGEWAHSRIVLKPETTAFGYYDLVFESSEDELVVIGEFLAVLA